MSAEATQSLRVDTAEMPRESVIFGSTALMRKIRVKVEEALGSTKPLLIQGESGTGKDLISLFVHAHSILSAGPFVKLNCAAMSNGLLEAELFGVEKDASTSAAECRRGALEAAEGGILFLDEIGEMDLASQAKLLGVLGDGHFSRVGGRGELVAHLRVICATRCDLEAAVARRAFRQDLFSSLNSIRIQLPPLRERREDIPLICNYLLGKLSHIYGKPELQLSESAFEILQQWRWPGNTRELENWIARIVVFGTEEVLGLEFARQLASMSTIGQRKHRIVHLRAGAAKRTRRPHGG